MKALVKLRPEKGIWMEDVPKPSVGVNDVLIKIKKTAICGTDLHIYKWDDWSQKTSKLPGYRSRIRRRNRGYGERWENLKIGDQSQAKDILPVDTAAIADEVSCMCVKTLSA